MPAIVSSGVLLAGGSTLGVRMISGPSSSLFRWADAGVQQIAAARHAERTTRLRVHRGICVDDSRRGPASPYHPVVPPGNAAEKG